MHRGFTMAEVLITLGIIGIIAAMTLPQLIKNHEKKVLHTQFLKIYSDLGNAAILFQVHEGFTVHEYSKMIKNSDQDRTHTSTELLKLYMKYFNGKSSLSDTSAMNSDVYSGAYDDIIGTLTALNGNQVTSYPCDESGIMTDISGRFFIMDNLLTGSLKDVQIGPKICVDINGSKGPNRYGYDWFVFIFTNKNVVIPYIGNSLTAYGEDLEDPSTYCSYTQNSVTYTCAYYALQDVSPTGKGNYWMDFLR